MQNTNNATYHLSELSASFGRYGRSRTKINCFVIVIWKIPVTHPTSCPQHRPRLTYNQNYWICFFNNTGQYLHHLAAMTIVCQFLKCLVDRLYRKTERKLKRTGQWHHLPVFVLLRKLWFIRRKLQYSEFQRSYLMRRCQLTYAV